jgi:hypothetical protein
MMKQLKTLILGTLLSILVFLAVQFIQVLTQFQSPWRATETHDLHIGFPLEYYFQTKCFYHGWNLPYLFLDVLLFWVLVTTAYFAWLSRRAKIR